jgi:hypothetical protein
MKQRTFILHMPKTGGGSLEYNVYANIPNSNIYNYTVSPESRLDYSKMPSNDRDAIRYVISKSYGDHWAFNGGYQYVTIVRNPVDRILSEYFFSIQGNVHFHKHIIENNLSLIELCELKSSHIFNLQTRLIAGKSKNSADTLKVAKENIVNSFAAVGILEEFPLFLSLLQKLLGWESIFLVKKNRNRGRPNRKQISKDIIAYLEEKNSLDLELHQFVTDIFNKLIKKNRIFKPLTVRESQLNNGGNNASICKSVPESGKVVVYGNKKNESSIRYFLNELYRKVDLIDWIDFRDGVITHGHDLSFLKEVHGSSILPGAVAINAIYEKYFRQYPNRQATTIVAASGRLGCYCQVIQQLLSEIFGPVKKFLTVPIQAIPKTVQHLLQHNEANIEIVLLNSIKQLYPRFSKIPKHKIYIYGAGGRGLECKRILQDKYKVRICGWIDSNKAKQGMTIVGVPVFSFFEVTTDQAIDGVVIASQFFEEILSVVLHYGTPAIIQKIFIYVPPHIKPWMLVHEPSGLLLES